ncbi:MAG: hypothetical protein AAFX06_24475 [Planctomycetota bacterium]
MSARSIAAAALMALAVSTPAVFADDWRDKEDGVLYLTSVDPMADEYFVVTLVNDEEDPDDDPDWKLDITYYRIGPGVFEVDTKDYDAEDIQMIDFEGDDNLDGFYNYTSVPSVAYGHGGTDYLIGGDGPDDLFGGSDNDHLEGRGGEDDLFGGWGRDSLYGGAQNDYLNAGRDRTERILDGGAGWDTGVMYYSQLRGTSRVYQQFDQFECESVQERWTFFFALSFQR